MKYKALMLDVDGTLIPYDYKALPSKNLSLAIQRIQNSVHVSLVTGRSYISVLPIIKSLGLKKGLAVVNQGAVVVNIENQDILYDMPIPNAETQEIVSILRKNNINFYLKHDPLKDTTVGGYFGKHEKASRAYMIFTDENLNQEEVEKVFSRLSSISSLTLYKSKHKAPNSYGFTISHINATKLHGIEVVMKHFQLKKVEIIGCGDSYNDFPLLMASGLKVAMGNAISELKELADFVAPPVTEDGVVAVIDKYLTPSNSKQNVV